MRLARCRAPTPDGENQLRPLSRRNHQEMTGPEGCAPGPVQGSVSPNPVPRESEPKACTVGSKEPTPSTPTSLKHKSIVS